MLVMSQRQSQQYICIHSFNHSFNKYMKIYVIWPLAIPIWILLDRIKRREKNKTEVKSVECVCMCVSKSAFAVKIFFFSSFRFI